MATTVKTVKKIKKKNKLTLVGKASILCLIMLGVYFLSATVLRSYNGNLQNNVSSLESQISQEQENVSSLELQVQALMEPDKIQEQANAAGLESKPENVVNLPSDDE